MRNVVVAVFAAVGLSLAGLSAAFAAGERPASPASRASSAIAGPYSSKNGYTAAQSGQDGGQWERKCMRMSCGNTWCYKVRR